MPVEVVVKDHEIAIYIDKKRLAGWLQGGAEAPVPWEEGNDERKSIESEVKDENAEAQGYRTGDGTKKEFPNPVGDTDGSHVADDDIGESRDTVNLFDVGPNGVGGTLQDDAKGKEKIKELRDWLKKQKFNYRNFCTFLHQLKEVAGFKLAKPLIGLTQKGEPTIFQLATRYHSYWKASHEQIAKEYKQFLLGQLNDMGITIQMVEKELDGEEIDPKNLPKGIEVSV
jgi:hypothetical protein